MEAAATPTAFTTEYGASDTARITRGGTVFVTGATSSIGLVAVQVAKELGAVRVLATTRTPAKSDALRDAGADDVLVTDNESIASAVLDATDGVGVDIVLDHIGGDTFEQVISAAKDGGTVVSVGRLGGGRATIDLFALARRHVLVRSVSYGLNPPKILGDLFTGVRETLMPAIVAGRVRPIVRGTHTFHNAPDAFDQLRAAQTVGKIVVTI